MTAKRMEELDLLDNATLAVIELDQQFDTTCLREHLLFSLKTINSSMLDESLDITLFEYNRLLGSQQPSQEVAHLNQSFFSLGTCNNVYFVLGLKPVRREVNSRGF